MFMYVSSAFILRSLTGHLPKQNVNIKSCKHLQGLSFADPNFIKSGRIDLLIGVDIIPQLMLPDIRKGNMVQRFFELDQVFTTRQLSAEEKWCDDHLQQTHIRQPNGVCL